MTDPVLRELAEAYAVATRYDDWRGRPAEVSDETLVSVLAALDVDASTPDARHRALDEAHLARWRQTLPPTVVQRAPADDVGEGAVVPVHCRHGDDVELFVECEDGSRRADVEQLMVWVEPMSIDGELRGEATFRLPADLPPGWHRLIARTGSETATATLVVTPHRLPPATSDGQQWGLAVQLYAARSRASWGIGDLADLRTLVQWTAERSGAFVLVSPLAASAPVLPIEPSPYYPASRRFTDPIYLRPEEMQEYVAAGWGTRQRVADERATLDATGDRIDRDSVWLAKRAAFALLWPGARTDPLRLADVAAYRAREGEALERFALWCTLAERYGGRWPEWPRELQDPSSPAVATVAEEYADRVQFYCWLQMCCDEQLRATQQTAVARKMPIGVVHDLPVGVNPGGADTWARPDMFAAGVTVGAPADAFNQQGQDWQQRPWRPDRLAATGFAAYRGVLQHALRHAGGLRVDHVLGLFRQWWVPDGTSAAAGTYVRFDAAAMLGILQLEADRAGAVVVGEDLGTVEPGVRETLAERGILGSTVLWFETDGDGNPVPPEQWRTESLASVTTHDLPTTAGLLALSHVDVRDSLGLLDRSAEEERSAERHKRDGWLAIAGSRGMLTGPDETDTEAQLSAMHGLLAMSPCRFVAVSLADLVADPRQPNQPGTTDEYPNWRLGLARSDPGGDAGVVPVFLDEVLGGDALAQLPQRIVQVVNTGVGQRSVR